MAFFVIRYRSQVLFRGGWAGFCSLVNMLGDVKDLIFEVNPR